MSLNLKTNCNEKFSYYVARIKTVFEYFLSREVIQGRWSLL